MAGNPSSAGMGQGAAQVFDNRGVVNTFARIVQAEQQQKQLDNQALAKMMSQFDPTKLRSADQAKFSGMYNDLQNLYTKNKDLFRNPLKHQADYNKSQALINDMRSLAARSKNTEAVLSEAAKHTYGKDRFSPRGIQMLQQFTGMNSDDIVNAMGGRDLSMGDFQFLPDDIDPVRFQKEVHSIGANSIVEDPGVYQTHADDPTIPEDLRRFTKSSRVSNDAFAPIASTLLQSSRYADFFNYQWDNMEPAQQREARMAVVGYPGVDLNNGAHILSTLESAKHGIVSSETKTDKNPDYELQQDLASEKRSRNFQVSMYNRRRADDIADKKQAEYEELTKENMNITHTNQLLGKLYYPTSDRKEQVKKMTAPFGKMKPYMKDAALHTWLPEDYKSKDDFVNAVMSLQQQEGLTKGSDLYNLSAGDAAAAWDNKMGIIGYTEDLPQEGDPNKRVQTVRYITPEKHTAADVQPLIDILGGSKAYGFGQSFDGFKQVKIKRKK